MIKAKEFPEGEEVVADFCSVQYLQHDDTNHDDYQKITITTNSQGSGHYYVISTDKWAINDIDEMIKLLKDFKKRFPFK